MDMEDMEIHLRLFGLGEQAAGRTESTMHLSRGDTVGSLMEALRTEGSYLSARLPFNPSTGLRTNFAQNKAEDRLLILVNGRSVHTLQDLDTPLTDGDQVTIMPKAFGG
ncbi:MAG: MoaD/ThiS family protein [Anaerolineales bacterium]|nr:MAG: MoaD/ThiS family protein [Anaerolineales bacterium]